jgi:tRNA A37 threonylcarbamoyladenosine synthetase subunit TsaC/SUA5/YrdC
VVILTQTDTTVGFLSQDETELQKIKSRPSTKPFIKVYKNFKALEFRTPKSQHKILRRAKKTTFIVKNLAFRVAPDKLSSQLLRDTQWNYSTSANEPNKKYARDFCEQKADIIIQDKDGLFETEASRLFKINRKKIRRVR